MLHIVAHRQDVDIIVVAQTLEEAAEIVEKVIEKVRLAYGYVVIFETPCSVSLPNSMHATLLFSRWTVPSVFLFEVQIIGDFPNRHVQIITVVNRSIDDCR